MLLALAERGWEIQRWDGKRQPRQLQRHLRIFFGHVTAPTVAEDEKAREESWAVANTSAGWGETYPIFSPKISSNIKEILVGIELGKT